MADIIDFPDGELTDEEKKQIQEFIKKELKEFKDTYCESVDHLKAGIEVMAEYYKRFRSVVEDPVSKIYPDYDLGLFLLEGRIKKIRGMLKNLYVERS